MSEQLDMPVPANGSRFTFEELKNLTTEQALMLTADQLPQSGFALWPEGTYEVSFLEPAVKVNDDSGKTSARVPLVLDAVTELADPANSNAPSAGDEHSFVYSIPGGLPSLCADFGPLAGELLGRPPKSLNAIEILQALNGTKGSVTLGIRSYADKVTKEKKQQQTIVSATLLGS